MNLVPGSSLGQFRIVEQLGRGGMATVYKAYQPRLDRYVAIKVLPAYLAEEPGFVARFEREAMTIARLNHPNILDVYDFGEDAGVVYIVTPLLTDGTLARRVGSPLPLDEVLRLLAPLGAALDYAHDKGVLHRDFKPSNVLLRADGVPVLADFGIAKIVGQEHGLTQTGAVIGTPEYMAPEQALGEQATRSSDDYALAVVAYQLLTGVVPFRAETPVAVLLAHAHKALPLPHLANPSIDANVERALLKGLAKQPQDRYATAAAFVDALAGHVPATESAENRAGSPQPLGQGVVPETQVAPDAATTPPRRDERGGASSRQQAGVQTAGASSPRGGSRIPLVAGALVVIATMSIIATVVIRGSSRSGYQSPASTVGGATAVVASLAPTIAASTNAEAAGPTATQAAPAPSATPVRVVAPTRAPTAVPPARTAGKGAGHITYHVADGHVFRIAAEEGAAPKDINLALDALAPGAPEKWLSASPDGAWLLFETQRFNPSCADWACLALSPASLASVEVIKVGEDVVHPGNQGVIANGGNLSVVPAGGGPHQMDLWSGTRISAGGPWKSAVLTAASPYAWNHTPSISPDGRKVLFDCGDQPYGAEGTAICEVGTDGNGFHVVLTVEGGPPDMPKVGALHSPSYAPDGSIVFEGAWDGETIWRLPKGATTPVKVAPQFHNDNSPCVLPDGRIVSLWVSPDGGDKHQMKVMLPDGKVYVILLPGVDVEDTGISCGA
jgi:hypothetical protein